MIKLKLTNRLVVKLAMQMTIVIVIIAAVFYFIMLTQAKEMEKRIFDKANLLSSILGANLDKIVGDSLQSYQELQQVTVAIAKAEEAVEEVQVIAPELVVLSSNLEGQLWTSVGQEYFGLIEQVVKNSQAKSLVKAQLGSDLVIHFMPLFIKVGSSKQLSGVMKITVKLPSQQGQLVSMLRTNKSAYFKAEALDFAQQLSYKLQTAVGEAQRNFNYLEELINNMLRDKEILDIRLFSEDLQLLGSGSYGRSGARFVDEERKAFYKRAMREGVLTSKIEDKDELIEVVSPLYLMRDNQRRIGGAVGIVISLSQIDSLVSERRNSIMIMSLVIIAAFCLLIGLFFKRIVISPINELIGLTDRIGHGDFSQKTKLRSHDEIAKLAEAFNHMSDELEKSKQEIEEWNLNLQDRVDKISEELKTKQEQLLQSEKMASLGVLSSGIAHEINNPLGIILGHTQILLKEFKARGNNYSPEDAQNLLEAVEENTKRCSRIVKSLLHFARKRHPQFQPTDMAVVLENALEFTKNRLHIKEIKVNKNFSSSASISADPIQLEQVFINILLNAEQSIVDNGRIEISVSLEKVKGKDEKYIFVVFEDNGRGISTENIKRIFDPFFSTKEPGEGVGLGLSVSYGIIKAHAGDIEVKSEVGVGTRVVVKLPTKRNA